MTDTDQRNVAAFTLWSLIYQREQPFLPGMRTLIYSFLNHWNLFAWEFDLWWDSETLYIPTISFCFLNCDLTQVMPWFWVSDKICDVNDLYITHIQVITFIFKEMWAVHGNVLNECWPEEKKICWVRLNELKLVHQAQILFTVVHSSW